MYIDSKHSVIPLYVVLLMIDIVARCYAVHYMMITLYISTHWQYTGSYRDRFPRYIAMISAPFVNISASLTAIQSDGPKNALHTFCLQK